MTMKLIDKDALVAEIKKRIKECEEEEKKGWAYSRVKIVECVHILSLIDTLEVKEPAPISYVVSRSEEHADYVEEVFFDENKAKEYCDQFNGDENEYVRHITKVKVTL